MGDVSIGAASEQHLPAGQQRGNGRNTLHSCAASYRPSAGARIVNLGRVEWIGLTVLAAGNEDLAIPEQGSRVFKSRHMEWVGQTPLTCCRIVQLACAGVGG